MFKLINLIFVFYLIANVQCAWEHTPNLPTNRRTQYYLQKNTGDYKYGFDTGNGYYAEQSANDGNQVVGHFAYPIDGKLIEVRYTAGVQGYIPENIENFGTNGATSWSSNAAPAHVNSAPVSSYSTKSNVGESNDGSYSFSYATDNSARDKSADANGNVRGYYSYQNDAGSHDLSYTAGADSGFVVSGGSLADPSTLNIGSNIKSAGSWSSNAAHAAPAHVNSAPVSSYSTKSNVGESNDGSYSFSYATDNSARDESADANGNVRGYYSYQKDAGSHDLSYTAGADSGFVVTGGSLADPSTLNIGSNIKSAGSWSSNAAHAAPAHVNSAPVSSYSTKSNVGESNDGSYSFSYATDNSARDESADANGNVRGYYSYQNDAGSHDLSYTAGADSGFVVTGGSLADPSTLNTGSNIKSAGSWSSNAAHVNSAPVSSYSTKSNVGESNDGSYSFSYATDNSARDESADANGNVRGYYSYQNDAGSHDLSYTAGADSGFVVTGGSLAAPNHLNSKIKSIIPFPEDRRLFKTIDTSQDTDSNIARDASYKFTIDTDDYQRQEESDSQGNIRGKYSYNNNAGSHDLYYVAGKDTGFIVTGGSLSEANGLVGKSLPIESENPASLLLKAIPLAPNDGQKSVSNLHVDQQPDKYNHDNIEVTKFLPGGNHYKTGYIFDSQ